jgi:hypothetical protein
VLSDNPSDNPHKAHGRVGGAEPTYRQPQEACSRGGSSMRMRMNQTTMEQYLETIIFRLRWESGSGKFGPRCGEKWSSLVDDSPGKQGALTQAITPAITHRPGLEAAGRVKQMIKQRCRAREQVAKSLFRVSEDFFFGHSRTGITGA